MQTDGPTQTELPSHGASRPRRYPDRVLVVAADQVVREVLDALISIEGCEVRTESDPARAVQTAAAWKPNVVLWDVDSPGVDARPFIEELRNTAGQNIPVVVLSSRPLSEPERLVMGASGFLPKPINVDDLLETVQQYAAC